VRPRAVLLAGILAALSASPAFAVKEWYDYYLDARDNLIPAKRWDEALSALKEAERLKPASALNERPYGQWFVDYLPYYYSGLCYLEGKQDYNSALRMFNIEEAGGAIKKNGALYEKLRQLRNRARDLESERLASGLRLEVDRLLKEAADLYRGRKFDEALTRLAEAQSAGSAIDQARQQQIRDLTEKIKVEKRDAQATETRTRRVEDALLEGRRLLEEGRPNEASVRFDEVLGLDPKNAKAQDGKAEAEQRILASTTKQSREASLRKGKALLEANHYDEALAALSDAAADPLDTEARDLREKARRLVERIRDQKDLRVKIERLMGEGEAALGKRAYAEAAVAYDGVLQIDPSNVRAKERLAEAERNTGNALLAKWLPNQKPILDFYVPRSPDVVGPTVAFVGVATDDRGIAMIEFWKLGKVLARVVPLPALDPLEPPRSVRLEESFPLEPGANDFIVTATDVMGLTTDKPFRIVRHLRFYETAVFLPSALASALGIIGFGLFLQRARQRRAVRNRFNPYIAGAPVMDDEMFFGRQKLMSRILNVLHHNSLMITGERRIGKTTFLYHLGKALQKDEETEYKFFPVFTDLQGVPESGFFHAVIGDVVEALTLSQATLSSLRFDTEDGNYDGRDFSHDLQRIIEELKSRTPKRVKLALLIDEVDVLNAYSERINQRLRSIFMKTFSEHLVAIMSGVGIKRTWKSEGSPWYNFFDEVELSAFAHDEAEALIRTPVTGFFRYEPEAVEAIIRYSALRPYIIQKFCIHAINRILEHGRTTVTVADIEAVRESAEGEGQAEAEEQPEVVRSR
jgi:tetratricopeptide (TPR) repeat protein